MNEGWCGYRCYLCGVRGNAADEAAATDVLFAHFRSPQHRAAWRASVLAQIDKLQNSLIKDSKEHPHELH